jgi:ribosome-binding protein aMBF1 (putative translation factor)
MSEPEQYHNEELAEILASITPQEHERTGKRMQLADRIEDAMIAKGWKKSDLATAMNKRPSVIASWLSGIHNFNTETLFDIEAVLNINLVNIEKVSKQQEVKYKAAVCEDVVNDITPDYLTD